MPADADQTTVEIERIVKILRVLPPERIASVHDYVLFLVSRYGYPDIIDDSDVWTAEDMRDVTIASLNYAVESFGGEDYRG